MTRSTLALAFLNWVSGKTAQERRVKEAEERAERNALIMKHQNMELHYMNLRMQAAELKFGRDSKGWKQADQDFRMVRLQHAMVGGIVGSVTFKYPEI